MSDEDDRKKPRLVAIDGDAVRPANDRAAVEEPLDEQMGANDDAIRLRIAQLEEEHRDLDTAINTLEERMPYDRLTIQRLKKRKLALKDQLTDLHDKILPDIIA
ncbi:MAG: DUF465 domain-containing protein [Parvularcula sp.]|jgi:hypothetical protein|nr:DUF465 domain-containing protein [Parvularcula sp.]